MLDTVRAYDPEQEYVVLLMDSITDAYMCWVVKYAETSSKEEVVCVGGHG